MANKILEKDVVSYLIDKWDIIFEGQNMFFQKREWQAYEGYRADILAYTKINPLDLGYDNNIPNYRASIVIECKYKSSQRDLIYEIKKAIRIKEYLNKYSCPFFIHVISDDYSDKNILNFLIENEIVMWKLKIKNNDINTLTLDFFDPFEKNIKKEKSK